MARLSRLTQRDSVLAAIQEFDELGRDMFLGKYGYGLGRDYFLELDGNFYDSKAIVGVAFGYEHPNDGPLVNKDFKGGTSGAVRALQRLGFNVTSPAIESPPQVGDQFANRTAIQFHYGGDKQSGIIHFSGDKYVNAFADEVGEYVDELPSLTAPFGYRGEGQTGDQGFHRAGNRRLEEARIAQEAIRFW